MLYRRLSYHELMLRPLTLVLALVVPAVSQTTPAGLEDAHTEKIRQLEARLAAVEATLQTLLADRTPPAAASLASTAPALSANQAPSVRLVRKETMPPELLPEIGKVGAEVGILLNGSVNPYGLDKGTNVGGFIDLPLFDQPSWLHGKVSYEISIGLSRSKTTFTTTSNVAQVSNLAVLNALSPNTGFQNIIDSVTGTGTAPFPVKSQSTTTMKLLQVVPFSFKYTTTALDRFRLRPYALLGFGTYVTIHQQTPANSGVRLDANLPAGVVGLVNQVYGGQAPFGGQLVAGQITQSPELEARGLPSGHGSFDLGWLAGGGVEYRLMRTFSIGLDSRWNRIAGAPGALTTFGGRMGFHF
jgi:hypothetical protein